MRREHQAPKFFLTLQLFSVKKIIQYTGIHGISRVCLSPTFKAFDMRVYERQQVV